MEESIYDLSTTARRLVIKLLQSHPILSQRGMPAASWDGELLVCNLRSSPGDIQKWSQYTEDKVKETKERERQPLRTGRWQA